MLFLYKTEWIITKMEGVGARPVLGRVYHHLMVDFPIKYSLPLRIVATVTFSLNEKLVMPE